MKKYIIPILILLAIPSIGFAGNEDVNQNVRIDALEAKAKDLEKLVGELQTRMTQAEADHLDLNARFSQHAIQVTPVVQIIQAPDQTNKINDLDKRVSYLEKAMTSIQTTVLGAINRAIGILEKLLK